MQKINLPKKKIKGLSINITLLFFVVIFLFFMIDIGVRAFLPQYTQIHKYDDHFLHVLIPNSEKIMMMSEADGGEKISIKINNKGFRNPAFKKQKEDKRVMVYGDSFIEGEFSNLKDTFTYRLEKKLNEKSEEVFEVINAGVIAYGPDQISLRIEDEVEKYNPDVIIVAVYAGNDYGELVRNKIYRLENGSLINNEYYLNKGLKRSRALAIYFPSLTMYYRGVNGIKKFIKKEDSQIKEYSGISNKNDCEEFITKMDNEIKIVFGDPFDGDIVLNSENYCSKYKIEMMGKIFNKIKEITSNRGVELLVLIIPDKNLVDDKLFQESKLPVDFNRSFLTDLTEELTRNQNMSSINLYSPFFETNINNSFYFIDDGHWNKAGQDFAASLVSDKILGVANEE